MFGITGVWVPYVVFVQRRWASAQSAAIMNEFGRLDHFFLYIAPHGQLELYSIFLAAAAGLLIFWSWIAPGARTRRQALAEDGRAFFTVVVGLVHHPADLGHHRGLRDAAGLAVADQDRDRDRRARRRARLPVGASAGARTAPGRPATSASSTPGRGRSSARSAPALLAAEQRLAR